MFKSNHKERIDRLDKAEAQLSQVIANLNEATVKVKKQANSLGDIADGLKELREALDNDPARV